MPASRGLYRFTLFTTIITYLLIVVGGVVHNTNSGMACPDWPLCYGEVFPTLQGGVLFEEGHRDVAKLVGFCVILITVLLWNANNENPKLKRAKKNILFSMLSLAAVAVIFISSIGQGNTHWNELAGGWVGLIALLHLKKIAPWLILLLIISLFGLAFRALLWRKEQDGTTLSLRAVGLLTLIILQGLLGGVTVAYNLPSIVSTAHLATSMLVLLTLIYITWELRQHTLAAEGSRLYEWPASAAAKVSNLLVVATLAIFFQIILGALVRHTHASWIAGIGWTNSMLGQDPLTGKISLWPATGPAQLNVAHRYFALAVSLLVGYASLRAWNTLSHAVGNRFYLLFLIFLPVQLVLLQMAIGVIMLGTLLEIGMRTAHLAIGTLTLAAQFLLMIDVRGALRTSETDAHAAGRLIEQTPRPA